MGCILALAAKAPRALQAAFIDASGVQHATQQPKSRDSIGLLLHYGVPARDAVKAASLSFASPRCATQFDRDPRILARRLCPLWSTRSRWHSGFDVAPAAGED